MSDLDQIIALIGIFGSMFSCYRFGIIMERRKHKK